MGIAQAFALIPGTSRSGATIIGGMLFGLSRKAATEFSFFLAVPDARCRRRVLGRGRIARFSRTRMPHSLRWASSPPFVSALLCVRWLIRYVARHDFVPFAWYRIVFGAVILDHGVYGRRPLGLTHVRQQ